MDITINRAALAAALAPAVSVCSGRSTVPVLTHVLLQAGEGTLRITATDLDTTIRCEVAATVKAPGETLVRGSLLGDAVERSSGEEIGLRLADNGRVALKSAGSRMSLATLQPEDFPLVPARPESSSRAAASCLLGAIRRVLPVASINKHSSLQMDCVQVTAMADRIRAVATDGHRMMICDVAGAGPEAEPVLISTKGCRTLLGIAGDGEIEHGDGDHLWYRADGVELFLRRPEVTFPDYKRGIPTKEDAAVEVDTAELLAAVQRLSLFTGERAKMAKLSLSGGELTATLANPDIGSTVETVACTAEGTGEGEVNGSVEYLLGAAQSFRDFARVRLAWKKAANVTMRPVRPDDGMMMLFVMAAAT